jgi:hypothetical protein
MFSPVPATTAFGGKPWVSGKRATRAFHAAEGGSTSNRRLGFIALIFATNVVKIYIFSRHPRDS